MSQSFKLEMYTLLAHYLSPLLLILFLMDNAEWIDSPLFLAAAAAAV